MADWKYVGEIKLVQTQLYAMTGQGQYDTHALVKADRLRLTPDGVFGLSNDAWVVDRHHRHHPDAKHWHTTDTLSFGFTSHYDHMWSVFRKTPLGRAGENVIVDAPEMLTIHDLAGGLLIETEHGAIGFSLPEILEPCVQFTRFMTDRKDADATELKPWRDKLRNGVRGYVVGIDGPDPVEISPGDRLSVRPAPD